MLGCGRLTTKLGSSSWVGYIWCIRLSPLAWYLAQSVARLYTCLLPLMRGLQFLLQFFLVFKYNGNGPAHTQMQRRPHCTTGVAFSVPPSGSSSHPRREDRCSPLPHKPTFRTNKKNRFLWLPCCQSRSK